MSRVVTLGHIPGLEALLERWERVRGPARKGSSYYALPGQRDFPATQVDTWLKLVLDHFGVRAPAGESWTGHSSRKGAASAMSAAGVSIDRICHVGGWSVKAKTIFDYVDPTCPDTAAGRRYFGWLVPAARA